MVHTSTHLEENNQAANTFVKMTCMDEDVLCLYETLPMKIYEFLEEDLLFSFWTVFF